MRRYLVFVLVFTLLLSLGVPTTSMAATEDKVQRFEKHLNGLDKSTPFVKEQVGKYNKLSEKQKRRLVELIYDPMLTKKLIHVLGTIQSGETIKLSNGEVVIKSEAFSQQVTPAFTVGDATISASEVSWSGWHSWTMTFLGVDVTTLRTKVFYTCDLNNVVIRSDNAVNSHYNIDPLVIVTDGVSSHWKSGGYAFGNGPFTVYGTATLGFVSSSVAIIVQAKPSHTTGWKESI